MVYHPRWPAESCAWPRRWTRAGPGHGRVPSPLDRDTVLLLVQQRERHDPRLNPLGQAMESQLGGRDRIGQGSGIVVRPSVLAGLSRIESAPKARGASYPQLHRRSLDFVDYDGACNRSPIQGPQAICKRPRCPSELQQQPGIPVSYTTSRDATSRSVWRFAQTAIPNPRKRARTRWSVRQPTTWSERSTRSAIRVSESRRCVRNCRISACRSTRRLLLAQNFSRTQFTDHA